MIIALILNFILSIIAVIFTLPFFPVITQIPFVDSYLVSGFGIWNAFMLELPFLQVVWQCFVWYMLFKISLMLIKFFLGHRISI